MALFLKQSTACTIMFGPFVDKTDGVTLKTDATTITDIDHATTGIFLSKNGAAAAIRHQTVTASVADAYGMMQVTLDTTDTNTLGSLDVLFAKAATYLPVHKSFEVVTANVYDSLIGGGDVLDVSAIQFAGQTITAAAGVTIPTSIASPTNITAGTITTTTDVTNPVTLTVAERNSTADAILDRANAIEVGLTLRQAIRLAAAAMAGKLSGATTTTIIIRNPVADSKNRIIATVDADGNRSAITYDVS